MNSQGQMNDTAFLSFSPLGMPASNKQIYTYLKILQWNSNSLGANYKIPQLKNIANQFDVLGLCETGSFIPDIKNFACIKQEMSPVVRHRGVAMYIHKALRYRTTDFCRRLESIVESIAIEVPLLDRDALVIWMVYVHPTLHASVILDILEAVKDKDVIIIGDQNSKCRIAGNIWINPRGNLLDRLILDDELPFRILNDGNPTFIRHYPDGVRTSVIDLAICNAQIAPFVEECRTTAILDSDHVPVKTVFKLRTERLQPSTEPVDIIIDPVELKRIFNSIEITPIGNYAESFQSYLQSCIQLAKRHSKQKKRFVSWWNRNVRTAYNARNRALKIPVEHPNRRRIVAQARKRLKHVIQKVKADDRTEISKNSSNIFKILRGKRRKRSSCNLSLEKSVAKANEINETFAMVEHHWYRDLNQQQIQKHIDHVSWRNQRTVIRNRAIPEISGLDLQQLFKNTKKGTAPGYDKISDKVMECFTQKQWNALAQVMNYSSEMNEFPAVWKHAILIALEKPTGGYRPISLLPKTAKLFERIVLQELMKHTSLPSWQFCKKKSSAPLAVSILHHQLVSRWWRKQKSIVAFFDIRKAFDSVHHASLIKLLHDIGVPDGLTNLLDSWLKHRTVQTSFNGMYSEISRKNLGIPQGSPLSLMLFVLYISDLPAFQDCQVFGYADDIAISIPCDDSKIKTEERVTSVCNQVIRWTQDKLLHLNLEKLELLHVTPMEEIQIQLEYHQREFTIKSKDQVKYLGMHLHSSLYFDHHMNQIIPELKRRTNLIRGLCWKSPPSVYRQVYKLYVRSKLAYCGHLLSYSISLKQLETIQNTNLRNILKAYFTSPVLTLRAATNVPSIEVYSQFLKCTFISHLENSGKRVQTNAQELLTPIDQGYKMIHDHFGNDLPEKKKLKQLMKKDMMYEYWNYTGCFRFLHPRYPRFRLYKSPKLTSMAFRAATGHMNIGCHKKNKRLKGNYKCRFCSQCTETLQHLLSHVGYRSRCRFFDVLRGSRGTEVDRIRLFRVMINLQL